MNPRRTLAAFVAVTAIASARPAYADPVTPAAVAHAPPLRNDGSWGLWIVLGSLAAGTALTVTALTVDCGPTDLECQRWTSLGIWGGVGVAAIGAFTGLIVIEKGARDAKARATARIGVGANGLTVNGSF